MQVLTNLLSNAAKFSPQGGTVHVGVRVAGEAAYVHVRDEGAGIAPQFHARIFERFAQADSSDSRAKGGTGLGLWIAKTLMERLGGEVGFQSEPGDGAEFHISLPLHRRPVVRTSGGEPSLPGYHVLVCEDDPDVARFLGEILRQEGMRAKIVSTAREARAALATERFDVTLIDLHLPDADGLELIAELRLRDATRALPVIVVTARPRHAAQSRDLGALHLADWLQKPIDPQRLLDAIGGALSPARPRRARILHVEDDESITQLVQELLANDADVLAAHSLAEARRCVDGGGFDLVILDIELGDGSGLDVLPLLREGGGAAPPVILYSASEASRELAGLVQAALVKSRDSVEQLLASVATSTGAEPQAVREER